ncbi:hypothetical protein HHU12_34270 [Flammeovirga aprica JL-4]|uniref:Hybrid sensor histidine kinase/response regulator n=1 Tax=Flammeovirga aprica JL-4 TaxID=694437 RepID=A0A7X9S2B2_9BACT|nr:two-component regulator propeller domain-containing protein [Flammeovirga aprica]NME73067.1 hypothetical protein [Flammeovirga aprica JL-4]
MLWVGNAGGLNFYNREKDRFERVALQEFTGAKVIKVAKEDHLWIGGLRGLYLYNTKKKEIVKSVTAKYITKLLIDKNDNIWIGTETNGILVINKKGITKMVFKASDKTCGLTNNNIEVIHQDKNGIIRVGTEGGGLHEFDFTTKKFHSVPLPAKVVWDILEVNDRLWLGTPEHGVIVLG